MRRKQPIPPEGVEIVRMNGERVPLELIYQGRRRRIHRWTAVIHVRIMPGDQLQIQVLPPRTEVRLGVWLKP